MNFDKALEIAARAHAGQKDKVGEPYILHPLRLMLKMSDAPARIVALLHDVVEDSDITLADLRKAGFSSRIVSAVAALTRGDGEPYARYVERASRNALARRIKIADLEDNMELRRLHGLAARDKARMARYRKAYRFLTGDAG